jgi:hypothetical protein
MRYTITSLLPLKFILGSKSKDFTIKRGRGRPPKPKDPLTDMEKNDGAVAARGRPAVKDISTNWHCIEDKVKIQIIR